MCQGAIIGDQGLQQEAIAFMQATISNVRSTS
jgi:hypothetical protein